MSTLLKSNHNIGFHGEIRKKSVLFRLKNTTTKNSFSGVMIK